MEEDLFPASPDKVTAAIEALESSVGEFGCGVLETTIAV
jgi:hypothetical protein